MKTGLSKFLAAASLFITSCWGCELAFALPAVQDIVDQVSQASYTNYLDNLLYTHTGDSRKLGGAEHDLARDNIYSEFINFGLAVSYQPFTYSGSTYYNVVGVHPGSTRPNDIFIVGAHYDSTSSGSNPAPGADDNGSGSAGRSKSMKPRIDTDSHGLLDADCADYIKIFRHPASLKELRRAGGLTPVFAKGYAAASGFTLFYREFIILLICVVLFGSDSMVIANTPSCPECQRWNSQYHRCEAIQCYGCDQCVNNSCVECGGNPNLFCCCGGCAPLGGCWECTGNGSCLKCGGRPCEWCDMGNCAPSCKPELCQSCVNGACRGCDWLGGFECCTNSEGTGGECYFVFTQVCCGGQIYPWPEYECCGDGAYNHQTHKCCTGGPGQDDWTCEKEKECCNGDCCDPDECESCVDGECKVCGGDPNQKCCNGSCCAKVWTKRTTEPINTFCPGCGNGPPGEGLCGGTTTEISSYEQCLNVGVGEGEHCQCNSSLQTVGYSYPCMINWNLSMMAWCAVQSGWCAAECIVFMDPAGCGNCLAGVDCCGGPCEICDFVEECKKNEYSSDIEEQKSLVFTGFGC